MKLISLLTSLLLLVITVLPTVSYSLDIRTPLQADIVQSFSSTPAVSASRTMSVTSNTADAATIAGGAFVYSTTFPLGSFPGKRLTIVDSSNRTAYGWIQRKGTGPTFAAEMIADGDMEAVGVASWPACGASTFSTRAKNNITPLYGTQDLLLVGSSAGIYNCVCQAAALTVGALYQWVSTVKTIFNHTIVASVAGSACSGSGVTNNVISVTVATSAKTILFNGTAALSGFASLSVYDNYTGYFDGISLSRMTEPSPAGAIIVSTKGGAVQNFASITGGFDANNIRKMYISE